ncbi:MAG: DMT family transporter [Cypionkella sp.]
MRAPHPVATLGVNAPKVPAAPPSRKAVGIAWAMLGVLIFSGWFVVTRYSVSHELRIWDIAMLRFGIGAIVLLPAVLPRKARPSRAAWRLGFVLMLLWGVPFVLCVALGLQLTSAAQAASITPSLMPVFAGLFAMIFLHERPGLLRGVGFGIIVVGVALLVFAGTNADHVPNWTGFGALIAASAMWAGYTLIFRTSGLSPVQAAAMICVWSSALLIPVYLLFGLSRFHLAQPDEIVMQLIYQGILMSGVAIVVFNRAVALAGAATAASAIALIPAIASLLGVAVLGEVPAVGESVAIAIIVAGALLAARPRFRSSPQHLS